MSLCWMTFGGSTSRSVALSPRSTTCSGKWVSTHGGLCGLAAGRLRVRRPPLRSALCAVDAAVLLQQGRVGTGRPARPRTDILAGIRRLGSTAAARRRRRTMGTRLGERGSDLLDVRRAELGVRRRLLRPVGLEVHRPGHHRGGNFLRDPSTARVMRRSPTTSPTSSPPASWPRRWRRPARLSASPPRPDSISVWRRCPPAREERPHARQAGRGWRFPRSSRRSEKSTRSSSSHSSPTRATPPISVGTPVIWRCGSPRSTIRSTAVPGRQSACPGGAGSTRRTPARRTTRASSCPVVTASSPPGLESIGLGGSDVAATFGSIDKPAAGHLQPPDQT